MAPPTSLVSRLVVPDTDNIYFHPVVTLSNHVPESTLSDLPEYRKFPVHTLPFFCQVNHIRSGFVEVIYIMIHLCVVDDGGGNQSRHCNNQVLALHKY